MPDTSSKKVVTDEEVMQALREGVEAYVYLIDGFQKFDITNNTDDVNEWKDKYVYFFRLRGEVGKKLNMYFSTLESYKKVKCCDIDDAILIMKEFLDKFVGCQKSFVSKAIHMLNNDLPIIDKNVCSQLDLLDLYKKIGYAYISREKKLEYTVELYGKIIKKIDEIIKSDYGQKIITIFDSYFPEYKNIISPVKKIDFYHWKKDYLEHPTEKSKK